MYRRHLLTRLGEFSRYYFIAVCLLANFWLAADNQDRLPLGQRQLLGCDEGKTTNHLTSQ
jgi:hypothetical protein